MAQPIVLTADSACDLGAELLERYHVQLFPYTVTLDGKDYQDGVDLDPDTIYEVYREKKILPKTAAINVNAYLEFFKQFTDQGAQVIHINLGSGLSSACHNAQLAAAELDGVFVIDSCNLSTGAGLVVIETAERIAAGLPAEQIVEEVRAIVPKVRASFIIDSLEFLYRGGRCSALSLLGANLLKFKPCIEVNPADGTMDVGKKYRGSLDKCLTEYVTEKLEGRTDIRRNRIFITHAGIAQEREDMVKELVQSLGDWDEVLVTRAGCTISAHCGYNTLGVLFIVE